MGKESIYFSHDADAMNDPKCMLLISQMGMEGYGAFWALVELLRQQPDYKLSLALVPAIAGRLQMTEAKLKTVICMFDLFLVTEDSFFFSQSLRDRMQLMIDKKQQQILAGKKSGEVRRMKALYAVNKGIERPSNDLRTTLEQLKEKKVKRVKKEPKGSKEKKARAFTPPSVEEIELYCKERSNDVIATKFHDWYTSNGWMVGKNKMKDWKAAVRTWERENKNKKNPSHENSKQYHEL